MADFNIAYAKRNAERLRNFANTFSPDAPAGLLCRDAADDIDLLCEEIERLTAIARDVQ